MDHHNEQSGVEAEGVPAVGLLGMVLGVVIALGVVVAVGVQIALGQFKTAEVVAIEMTGYPTLRETNNAAQALLTQSAVIDAQAGVHRIPIERAMQLVVAESGAGTTSEVVLSR